MVHDSTLSQFHALGLQLQVAIDSALVETGITASQWRALDAALSSPGSSSADLARACHVTPQTMQQVVAHLEATGLLVRTPHPVHGRVQQIYLSNAGEMRHAEGSTLIAAVEDRVFMAFTPADRAAFARFVALASGALRRS